MDHNTIEDFEALTFRFPRWGLFIGDSVGVSGHDEIHPNPITTRFVLDGDNADDNIPQASSRTQAGAIGFLHIFPLDIVLDIISQMNIASVLAFRRVNKHCQSLVDTASADFRTVLSFPRALSTTVTLECGSFTLGTLASSLRSPLCSECRIHYGECLYLLTGQRFCYPCWRISPSKSPLLWKRGTAPPSSLFLEQHGIPHMRIIPGSYGVSNQVRITTYELQTPFFAQRDSYFSVTGQTPTPNPELCRRAIVARHKDWPSNVYSKWWYAIQPMRFATVLWAPYWDEHCKSYVGGFLCRVCSMRSKAIFHYANSDPHRDTYDATINYDEETELIWGDPWRRYTRATFQEHLEEFGLVKRIATDDGEGSIFVHEKGHLLRPNTELERQNEMDQAWELMCAVRDGRMSDLPDDRPGPLHGYSCRSGLHWPVNITSA